MDLKLELGDKDGRGDMLFVNGACPVTDDYTGSVAQRVFMMLRTFLGEWYLNQDTGIPYTQRILGSKLNKSAIDRILQERVLAEQGVASIIEFRSELNVKREYSVVMKIKDNSGGAFVVTN